ncbi:TonB-dependent receptor [Pseudoalteromonas aurantia]|uniref:TonB-dependent receptor n=2 Tax=Pseudoalteromonas TaxID=53246 RepID=A0A5S3V939_9GAMM|nr:TonB-dependent receptor [Pseudoalteromonas aurantia]TMO62880.1 TonB-dependent receptor [Pseudoalteromonas aurantia]TMO68408.1 TonB-dependent receptor [Pseudoalteromonas aurantia]TMO71148.1 TonB-dependent receptor [Pseudoalteromonas aurantia]
MNKLAFCMVPVALAVSAAVSADEKEQITSIENIVVYGEKAGRSLKDTTSSVAVITSEELANGQSDSYVDILSDIANVVFSDSLPSIRGVKGEGIATGSYSFTSGAKARVAVMTDGVAEPFVATLTGDLGLWDVQQIEVLRGPQSSNSGRNSMGGIIYVTTNTPSMDRLEASVRAGYANKTQSKELSAMVSAPIIENELAYRFTVQNVDREHHSQFQLADGDSYPFDPKPIKMTRINAKLQWTPSQVDGLDMLLSYVDTQEEGFRYWYLDGPDLANRTISTPWDSDTSYARDKDVDSQHTSLKTSYEINDNFDIELLVSDVDYSYEFHQYPLVWHVRMDDESQTIDGKFGFTFDDGLSGHFGVYKYDREQAFFNKGVYEGDDDSSSDAIYGEVTVSVSEQGQVIAGGRIEKEKQHREFRAASGASFIIANDETLYLPKIAYLHTIDEELTLGLSFRKGYNSGGGDFSWASSTVYSYDPEYVDTFEVSVRKSWGDALNLAANIFYNTYSDYQVLATGASGQPWDTIIHNIDEVNSYGFEAELTYAATDSLTLSGSFGSLHTSVENADSNNQHLLGQELPMAPSVTASIGADYWLTDNVQFSLNTRYTSDYQSKLLRSHLANNPQVQISQADLYQTDSYTETRVSVAYIAEDWRVDAYVNNAFDQVNETAIERAPVTGVITSGQLTEPRTVGFSVTYNL